MQCTRRPADRPPGQTDGVSHTSQANQMSRTVNGCVIQVIRTLHYNDAFIDIYRPHSPVQLGSIQPPLPSLARGWLRLCRYAYVLLIISNQFEKFLDY